LFEFMHAFWSFLSVNLRHAPVVEEFTASHGVAKMSSPIVGGVYIAHGSGDSTLSHDGVRFAEERFANHSYFCPLSERAESRAQAGTTGADDQYIVVVSFVFCGHMILKSVIAPLATSRM
jgi:hypothetical protein